MSDEEQRGQTVPGMTLSRSFLCFLAAATLLWAQESPARPLSELIQGLGEGDFSAREKATEAIRSIGAPARAQLEAALKNADFETRLRIEALLRSLPQGEVLKRNPMSATLISITPQERTAEELCRAIEEQSILRFRRPLEIPSQHAVSVAIDRKPLLESLDIVAEALGTRWFSDFSGSEVRFSKNPGAQPIRRYRGPLRCAFTGINRSRNIQFGLPATVSAFIQGQIDLEPESPIVGLWIAPLVTTLMDDQGRDLLGKSPRAHRFHAATNRRSFHFTLPFEDPDPAATQIATAELTVGLVIGSRYELFDLSLAGKKPKDVIKKGEVQLVIRELSPLKTGFRLGIEVSAPAVSIDEEDSRTIQATQIVVLDDQGKRLIPKRRASRTQAKTGNVWNFVFDGDAKPARIQANVLRATERREMKFKFEEIPLP